jgi:exosome complex component RRP4
MGLYPGEEIEEPGEFISGHGTYEEKGRLISTLTGNLERIDKLATVHPRTLLWYKPEVGDVVVGRVISVGNKRWGVDIRSLGETHLLLTSINLPGNVQRRRMESDEVMMREYFDVGDILCAEVQAVHQHGSSIHTRNERYGKIEGGMMVEYPPGFVRRGKSQFVEKESVCLVLGMNGSIAVFSFVDKESVREKILGVAEEIGKVFVSGEFIDDERARQML